MRKGLSALCDRREERALIKASICVSTRYRAWNHGTYEG
ncbi:hypothetical protein F383_35810 [Gossypium arboreum]|uniref:Uncharacterized protein n=1 Tax=Gossypium arboreum TaxID=29729 RepID=A0A0B0MB74_GOSAR|nr:hypothetical protein F383_20022 [Gossypium arboreum]KHG29383.1 hypothetical protein F383_35810 [Gossypium arboreum]